MEFVNGFSEERKGAASMSEQNQPVPGWTEVLGAEATNPPDPSTSGEIIHAFGKEWKISADENRIKAQFEQKIRSEALKAIEDCSDNPETYDRMMAAYVAERAAGHYNWDGRRCRNARGDVPGLTYLLYLLLRRCQPDVTEAQAAAIFQKHIRQAVQAIAWALGNFQTPEEVMLGIPPGAKRKMTGTVTQTLDG